MKETMVSMKAKKGNPYERDCEASLRQTFPDAHRTHETGYILQYDIISPNSQTCYECKRLKGISWNQLEQFYKKLKQAAPEGYKCYVLFKSNHQPALVFQVDEMFACYCIKTFTETFGVNFVKHEPVKRNKKVEENENNN